MKLILKILALPVILILKIIYLLANVLVRVSAYVIGPLMLFVTGCLIYSLIKTQWTNVFLLGSIDILIFLAMFFAGWLTCIVEDSCEWLSAFLHS